jgi:hypothetical protein
MLKKLSLVLSVFAALGFAVAISAPADAKEPQKNVQVNKNIQVKQNIKVNKNFQVNKNIKLKQNIQVNKNLKLKTSKFIVGKKYGNHIWLGHNRHRWHGRWYAYGVGPCWINIEDEWFWNELECPF